MAAGDEEQHVGRLEILGESGRQRVGFEVIDGDQRQAVDERDRRDRESDAFSGGETSQSGTQALVGRDTTSNHKNLSATDTRACNSERRAGAIHDRVDDGLLEGGAEIGDGLIVSNLSFPTALVRLGALDAAMTELAVTRASGIANSNFTKVLHLHISVSRDGAAAKRCAKRMGAGALIQGHLLKQRMLKLPVASEIAGAVRTAHERGKTIDDMVDLISDELLSEVGTVIAGTPTECISGIDEMLRAAKPYGFDIVDMASPLGPDWDEAIDLICREILPELECRSSSYGMS